MTRPLIAIIGSLDNARGGYEPPLRDAERGREACAELGQSLAEAGCDLLVFSSKPGYVESDVVRGYAQAEKPGRVVARPPRHGEIDFALPPGTDTQVVVQPDTSGEWELSFFRSLLAADGIVMIGGARSTRLAGIVALTQKVPVLPVGCFGGGAGQVWVNLDNVRNDATPEEIVRMGQPWSPESAGELVGLLLTQRARRARRTVVEEQDARRGRWAARAALLCTITALIVAWLGVSFAGGAQPGVRGFLLLLAIPMVAAAAGAMLRNLNEQAGWALAAARGLGAGFVTVFLYVAGELVSVPDLLQRLDVQRLLFFLAPLAFTAGFAFDRVLEKVLSGETRVPGSGTS
ncbi:hypothetical protein [Actinoplanes auranticolor]|uniref:hypothetical protein n=1 Tax=Actinoplanes auranticolor TaxID=47988 RepID=UPI001BB3A3DC|nr:hypothetical protein [Actinoplanes auranticolor]